MTLLTALLRMGIRIAVQNLSCYYTTDPSLSEVIVEHQDSLWPPATLPDPMGISKLSTRGIHSLARWVVQLALHLFHRRVGGSASSSAALHQSCAEGWGETGGIMGYERQVLRKRALMSLCVLWRLLDLRLMMGSGLRSL